MDKKVYLFQLMSIQKFRKAHRKILLLPLWQERCRTVHCKIQLLLLWQKEQNLFYLIEFSAKSSFYVVDRRNIFYLIGVSTKSVHHCTSKPRAIIFEKNT